MSRRDRALGRSGIGALAVYAGLSFVLFGLDLVRGPGARYSGSGRDPQIFIWAFAWWPHAILHGVNPFVTHAVWAPDGVNLAWATMVPGLALPFAPLTLAAGPVASYNVASILMPALAAWTAFLLCRHLTARPWPSLLGGYLFGFSSYVLGQQLGHPNMTAVFLLPLIALVLLRYLQGGFDGKGLALRLSPMLVLQILLSTEVAFTLTLAIACSLLLGFIAAPRLRRRIVASVAPIAASYLLAAVLTAPFVYYLVSALHTEAFHNPQDYDTDLLNLFIPTRLVLVGLGWSKQIAHRFPGNTAERGAYIGLPALAIVALFSWEQRKTAGGRFLTLSFLAATLATLGFYLVVDGHKLQELPWAHIGYRPLFDNVLPDRLSVYLALTVAVIVTLWASAGTGALRLLLPLLALATTVPYAAPGTWSKAYTVPAFFTDASYRDCLTPNENVLPLPPNSNGDADLWQAEADFHFRMAGGYVTTNPPPSFLTPDLILISHGGAVSADHAQTLRTFISAKGVTSVIVDRAQTRYWAAALNRIAKPHPIGGVLFYHLRGPIPPGCPTH